MHKWMIFAQSFGPQLLLTTNAFEYAVPFIALDNTFIAYLLRQRIIFVYLISFDRMRKTKQTKRKINNIDESKSIEFVDESNARCDASASIAQTYTHLPQASIFAVVYAPNWHCRCRIICIRPHSIRTNGIRPLPFATFHLNFSSKFYARRFVITF